MITQFSINTILLSAPSLCSSISLMSRPIEMRKSVNDMHDQNLLTNLYIIDFFVRSQSQQYFQEKHRVPRELSGSEKFFDHCKHNYQGSWVSHGNNDVVSSNTFDVIIQNDKLKIHNFKILVIKLFCENFEPRSLIISFSLIDILLLNTIVFRF